MSDSTLAKRRQSSPRFPFINLEKALARAKQLYDAGAGGPVLVSAARETWGYGEKSSGGHQTIAALKAYGLIEELNSGDHRQLKLTDAGIHYIRDERTERRKALAKVFALEPKAMRETWDEWGSVPPDDRVARSHLKVVRGFADKAVAEFLGIYRDNIGFAELNSSAETPSSDDEILSEYDDETRAVSNQSSRRQAKQDIRPDINEDVFTLDEGEVVFIWPNRLSQESYEDLESWTQLILRKIKRHIVSHDDGALT